MDVPIQKNKARILLFCGGRSMKNPSFLGAVWKLTRPVQLVYCFQLQGETKNQGIEAWRIQY